MPIYEFVCGECGHEFEKILSFSANAPSCASCGAENVTRQMGRPAIHFKGSGWYINDSKKGGGKTGNNNPTSATNGEGGETSAEVAKSDSTPAAENGSSESKPAESSKEAAPSKESASTPAKTKAETA